MTIFKKEKRGYKYNYMFKWQKENTQETTYINKILGSFTQDQTKF